MVLATNILFSVELSVEKVEEEVDIDLGLAEHVGHGHALVLQPKQVLKGRVN